MRTHLSACGQQPSGCVRTWQRQRASTQVSLLTRVLIPSRGPTSGAHLNVTTSQRNELPIPSHWGLGLQYMNSGDNSVHSRVPLTSPAPCIHSLLPCLVSLPLPLASWERYPFTKLLPQVLFVGNLAKIAIDPRSVTGGKQNCTGHRSNVSKTGISLVGR